MSNQQHNSKIDLTSNTADNTRRACLAGLIALGMAGSAMGGVNQGELDGLYVPRAGWAETQEVSRPALGEAPMQIGAFRIVFLREGWDRLSAQEKSRIRKRWVYQGTLRGKTDPTTFTTDHVMAAEARDGAIYSAGDVMLPAAGDPFCAGGIPLSGTETINIVMGSGAYQGLVNGTIEVKGTVNNCPGQSEFLQNNFEVSPGVGGLLFESTGSEASGANGRQR